MGLRDFGKSDWALEVFGLFLIPGLRYGARVEERQAVFMLESSTGGVMTRPLASGGFVLTI